MNLDSLMNMVGRLFVRKAVSTGINKGIDLVAGKGKPTAEMTPAERGQAQRARELTKHARNAAKITRRLGK